jgi:hypothetical protein
VLIFYLGSVRLAKTPNTQGFLAFSMAAFARNIAQQAATALILRVDGLSKNLMRQLCPATVSVDTSESMLYYRLRRPHSEAV